MENGNPDLDRSVKTYDIFAEIFLDTFISVNNDGHNMSIFKKDFGYGGERLKSYSAQPLRLGGMVAGRISLPAERDLKKQGKSGSDGPAPREALYSRMRERGNGTDGPESPPPFSNEIRTAMNKDRR